MKLKIIWLLLLFTFTVIAQSQENILIKSIQEFGVLPENNAATNKDNLQKAIDWAAPRGAALFVEPSEEPYSIDGGIILKQNVSLIGVHGPVGRGTRHPQKVQPVGSVFKIVDEKNVFITVEGSTQIKGIQFWYANQTISDPEKIINYPATIQVSKSKHVNGVTLSSLTFYGEYTAMDFVSNKNYACEQILFEHCYGYPLSGEFIKIDLCYDIPRILHCHVNPANRRYIEGQYSKKIIDAVVAKKTFTYSIERTDNAQVMDVFTFGAYGGIYLGEATYGQMTNFNFDCVTVGIHKLGNNSKNRNWQIAQGSIIANTGDEQKNVHPIIIEGKGHTSLINVEAFSGSNGALTSFKNSQDFLLVKGNEKLTVSLYGCRMNSYLSENPFTIENPKAIIQATDCIDKYENPFNMN